MAVRTDLPGGGVSRRIQHEAWMRRALEVARGGGGTAVDQVATGPTGAVSVDVPVGAVIYAQDGTELANGRNERELTGDPTAHAEILALRRAAQRRGEWRLDGCAL